MANTLLKNADVVLTMDDARPRMTGVDIHIVDGVIAAIGPDLSAPDADLLLQMSMAYEDIGDLETSASCRRASLEQKGRD